MVRVSIKRVMTASRVRWVGGHMLKPAEGGLVWSPFCCGGGTEFESEEVTVVTSESDIFGDERKVYWSSNNFGFLGPTKERELRNNWDVAVV